jgi:hypothetical protein
MRAFVAELKKRKYAVRPRHVHVQPKSISLETSLECDAGATEPATAPKDAVQPTPCSDTFPSSPSSRGRHIPASVRRAVFERDGGRCAYLDDRGQRCRETARLELHHREPFAIGGRHDLENVSLRCTRHNELAAEQDFGHAFMSAKREPPHFAWSASGGRDTAG